MRFALATVAALVTLTASSIACALDTQACLTASEKGQRARAAGKLREAREHFVTCAGECPAIVRKDCTQWTADVSATLPTVVFGARDKQERDLFDVVVSMDGEALVKKLDGKAVPVDPGPHTFVFEHAGSQSVTVRVLVKEGERARAVTVAFDGGSSSSTPGSSASSADPPGHTDAPPQGATQGGHTVFPWLVFGAGLIATGIGATLVFTAPSRPSNCNADTKKCTQLPGQSEADFRADQDRAGTADSQPTLGYVIGGAGLAVAIGGLVWHFLEPGAASGQSGLRITPWTTGRGDGGVVVGSAF